MSSRKTSSSLPTELLPPTGVQESSDTQGNGVITPPIAAAIAGVEAVKSRPGRRTKSRPPPAFHLPASPDWVGEQPSEPEPSVSEGSGNDTQGNGITPPARLPETPFEKDVGYYDRTTGKPGNRPAPSGAGSVFADAEALKKATAAKLGKLRASAEKASAEIVLQRPLSTWFFRTPVDDEMLFAGGTWTDPETKELYFVVPDMWGHSQLEGAVRPTLFVPYVTAATEGPSVHGIWAVSTVMGNTWTDSIHSKVLPISRISWVRTWTATTAKKYLTQEAEDDYGEPIWLAKTIFEQLDVVFPRKRQIQSDEDEVIGRLKGRKRADTQDPNTDPN